ncbi:MAG: hypothetical protein ACU841_14775 [Gammaproteobacteria bacterium]
MKTVQTQKYIIIAFAAMVAGMIWFNVGANEKFNTDNEARLIYQSKSANHSIFGYASKVLGEMSIEPKLIYVDQANGPAIHSYAHSGSETVLPWNVEYVDPAYGQAIYSYDRVLVNGAVKVLPMVVD